jgi:hypothetical protein
MEALLGANVFFEDPPIIQAMAKEFNEKRRCFALISNFL